LNIGLALYNLSSACPGSYLDWNLLFNSKAIEIFLRQTAMRYGVRKRKLLIFSSFLCLWISVFVHRGSAIAEVIASQLPARIVREYALISASARENYPDPKNWRLLGSEDSGQTWTLLDVQSNQVFRGRSQRRVYHLNNQKPYNTYRLEIEGSATVQLAELELRGAWVGVTNEEEVQIVATSSKEHPLLGAASEAFDHDPTSRWIDFGNGTNLCWLQCQYIERSSVLLTNIGQFVVAARRLAAHNPLGDKAGHVLASFTNKASRLQRTLSGYALTSANDIPSRDPRDWKLLGSNDGGETWQTLDVRRNELFEQRFQRRVFYLAKEAPYALYRLQIDCVRIPADQPNGASCVQLAEIEPLYSVTDRGNKCSLLVSSEGENPPIETLEDAFDGKARTKWLSFTEDDNNNRSSWVQWEYLTGVERRVINLRWIKALQAQKPIPVELRLEGIAVAWDPSTRSIGFLDESGFQAFRLRTAPLQIPIGGRVRLTGRLQLGQELPEVSEARLTALESPGELQKVSVGQALSRRENFFAAELDARVATMSEDAAGWTTLGLTSEDERGRMSAKIPSSALGIKLFPGCHVRLQGTVQTVLEEGGILIAGTIWVPDADHLKVVVETEKDWSQWPLYSLSRLSRTNGSVLAGNPVRVIGTIIRQDSKSLILTDKGTNLIRVSAPTVGTLPPGSFCEVVGFFTRESGTSKLWLAHVRPTSKPESTKAIAAEPKPAGPATQIRSVYERLAEQPGKTFPVRLRGVITYVDMEYGSFYIQDDTDGIAVLNQLDAGLAPLVRQEGTYVEVQGRVDPEQQGILAEGFVTVLGKGRMPEPRRHSWDYLVTGSDDSRWVQVEGVVSACEDTGLTLIVTGGRLLVVVNDLEGRARDRLLGSLVRINGVCQPLRDNRNRRVGLQLLAPYSDCVEVLSPAPEDPFDLATRKIAELADQSARSTNLMVRLVKTTGVVTYKERQLLYVQDGQDGARIFLRGETRADVGDRIEAVGFAESDGFSPRLVQAMVRRVGREPLPAANPLDLLGPDLSDQDATRVQIEATLVGQKMGKSVQVLELKENRADKSFSAFIPITAESLPSVPIGSRVRLTGVFRSEMETMADLGQVPTVFQLYLSGPQDITVLRRPSWWTVRHTLWFSAALATILLMALTWASSLHRQVLQRTEQLRVEIAEHKQTEEALETSDRFMRSLVQSLPQNILRKDKEGRFIFVNEFFCQTIGKAMGQVLGRTDADLFPADLAAKFRHDDEQVLASGKSLETVEQSRNANGEPMYAQVIKTPLFDAANQIMGIQVIFWDVTERKRAEARLEEAQKVMVDASRQAGMAEVAAGVLHNVGNVLNSVNVSASLVCDNLHKSKAPGLAKAVTLLRENEGDLGAFFAKDSRAKQLIPYLSKLAECLAAEQSSALQELQTLKKNIEHIKEIVAMQQSYAKIVGVTEKVKVTDLVEDALRLNSGTLARHEVILTKEYDPQVPEVMVERHKVLQILVNLIRNAKYACDESGHPDKRLSVRVTSANGCVNICTTDNGVGIAPENLTRIFNHGFTTRKDGHGFGLHSGALAAKEMGGTLIAQSEGVGKGASFTLCLPLNPKST
jgi:PAS domain S-box-containing protein